MDAAGGLPGGLQGAVVKDAKGGVGLGSGRRVVSCMEGCLGGIKQGPQSVIAGSPDGPSLGLFFDTLPS